jgi:hypothetical protein
MNGSVNSLVMVAQHAGSKKSDEDKEMLALATTWAKQNHGCTATPATACVAEFTSYQGFLTKLRSYSHIGRLAILAHSGGDTLTFYVPADRRIQEFKSLAAITGDLGASVPQVDKVEFLGCQVGRDPVAMWNLAVALRSHSVVGHTFFHGYQGYDVTVVPGSTAADISSQLPFQEPYLIPNTDLSQIAAHPGKVQIFAEWFTPDLRKDPLDKSHPLDRPKFFIRRAAALPPLGQPVTVDSLQKAEDTKDEIEGDLAPDLKEIRVVR